MEQDLQKRRGRKLRFLLEFAIMAIVLVTVYWIARPAFLGTNSLPGNMIAILKGADRVETFRVSPEPSRDPEGKAINGYPITATSQDQGASFANRLASVLSGNGVTRNRKKCGLRPGVAFRMRKDKEAVDVLICFECDVLWPHVVGEPADHPPREWQDFDPVRGELLKLSKEAFPDDPEIQSLPNSRR